MADEHDVSDLMNKLETVKDIRQKTIQLEKLKTKLRQEVNNTDTEDRYLEEYKSEMELLLQEKMAHVEELRLIHADINLLETTIKQAEEDRNRSLENAKSMYADYVPLKEQVDHLRGFLGLEALPELRDECDAFTPELLDKQKSGDGLHPAVSTSTGSQVLPGDPGSHSHHHHPEHPPQASHLPSMHPPPHHPFLLPGPSTSSVSAHSLHIAQAPPKVQVPGSRTPPTSAPPTPSAAAAAFRQQPPPMKACLSCHQQIHRNAPICPLCKAKSRSRNPKKPKRKLDE